jgi:glucose/arabinose dehydrogenase/plastocyanin
MVNPIAMVFDPAGRLFYTEKTTGNVRLYAGGVLQATPVINFSVDSSGEQGLLGITLDPDFTNNHLVYVYYTCLAGSAGCPTKENRVVRFVETGGIGSGATTIFNSPNSTGSTNHNGGNIHFAQDGKLYISIGEDATPSYSQDVTEKRGKIHRINGDGSIPSPNPTFTQTGALPSLYAMGLRNSFDFAIDPYTPLSPYPRIFASENGPGCDDEMNRIEAGYNYGWRNSYPCDDGSPSPTYNTINPLWYIPNGLCCEAPTGIAVYTGYQIPQWTNHIFMATYNNQVMRHMYPSGDRLTLTTTNSINGVTVGMDIETGPDGALWYIQGGGYTPGTLKRIVCSTCGGSTSTPTRTATPIPPSSTATRTNTPIPPTNTVLPSLTSTFTPTPTATPTGTFIPPSNTPIVPTNTTIPPTATRTPLPTNTPGGPSNTPTSTSTTQPSGTTAPTTTATAIATACTIEFTDVPRENTFYSYVRCLACRGILGGYQCGGPGEPCDGDNHPYFRPGNNITRGQIAKVVSNAASLAEDPGEPIYADVQSGHPFYAWINRLTLRGYMGGYPCGGEGEPCNGLNQPYFRPFNNVTRGQLSKITSNAANYNDTPVGQLFEDVPPSHPFYIWIQRLASRGIIGGYSCGTHPSEPCVPPDNRPYFRPGTDVTRGQASKIVASTFVGSCPQPPVQTSYVEIEFFDYQPRNLVVPQGTTVRWFNYDLDYHTATSGPPGQFDGQFDSGSIPQYDSWAFTFNTPGTYQYYCRPHPYMVGTITVTASLKP